MLHQPPAQQEKDKSQLSEPHTSTPLHERTEVSFLCMCPCSLSLVTCQKMEGLVYVRLCNAQQCTSCKNKSQSSGRQPAPYFPINYILRLYSFDQLTVSHGQPNIPHAMACDTFSVVPEFNVAEFRLWTFKATFLCTVFSIKHGNART